MQKTLPEGLSLWQLICLAFVSVFLTIGNSWNNPCDGRDHIASNEGKSLRDKSTDVCGFLAACARAWS